jgi:uncharacterized protein YcnI
MKTQLIAATVLCGLAVANSAAAHVTLADPQASPGAYYTSAFKVTHGCAGSPSPSPAGPSRSNASPWRRR